MFKILEQVVRTDTHCIDIGCHLGTYLQKISLSSTMGPGVSVDLASATGNA